MTESEETLYAIALTRLMGFNSAAALHLFREGGGAKAVYDHRNNIGDIVGECSERLVTLLKDWDEALRRAEEEMAFARKYAIQVLVLGDDSYPTRLMDCPDAPIVLYYRGNAQLNAARVVNIIGTRHCTTYGQDLVRRFVADMSTLCPGVIIVSGLAYGIDICAHRNALQCGLSTVGVLAHGLEKIYPSQHRETASQMTVQGGLLTEYMSHSYMDKSNFVRRNRIVAGMCDATVLVESAARGGGLITAEIAQGYGRNVFAFPGAVGARYSEGCNNLIRNNGAELITKADDLVASMGWQTDAMLQKARSEGIERSCFPSLTEQEQAVVSVLEADGDLQLNIIAVKANIPVGMLSSLLFQLEMKGVVKAMAGGQWHLLK